MQYIIIDLEWNQPLSYDSAVYRRVGSKLIFEMIQIGAVRVNERMEILDSVSIPIRPQQYVRIHPRIRRMTHLDEETLSNALTLSGNGRFTDLGTGKNLFETYGALRSDRTVDVTGAVTLPADARISAFNGSTRLTLSGGMSGAGKLIVSGNGAVVLPTANGYTESQGGGD